ncbi:MAG: hypothetical protein IJN64_11000 [Lachnospiraceae bacterium]|nr:hypothetical protein [Lachnospiraceae bacterium]
MKIAQEYIVAAAKEYDIEIGVKENIENRASYLMAFHGVTVLWLVDKIDMLNCSEFLTGELTIKSVANLCFVLLFLLTYTISMYNTCVVFMIKDYNNFSFEEIPKKHLRKIYASEVIWNSYKTIVSEYKKLNTKKAHNLQNAIIFLLLYILCMLICALF